MNRTPKGSASPQPVTFQATPESGTVSGQLRLPTESSHLVVFAHGAGAGMEHVNIQSVAQALAGRNLASLVFNFPFTEAGRRRVDSQAVSVATLIQAIARAQQLAPELPIILGGHSYGGRMASHAVLQQDLPGVEALVFCSFPLHPSGRPGIERTAHLASIELPMLFLSGTRDKLAERDLLQSVVNKLGNQTRLHWLDTADHGYRVLKRTRKLELDVFSEMAEVIAGFCTS